MKYAKWTNRLDIVIFLNYIQCISEFIIEIAIGFLAFIENSMKYFIQFVIFKRCTTNVVRVDNIWISVAHSKLQMIRWTGSFIGRNCNGIQNEFDSASQIISLWIIGIEKNHWNSAERNDRWNIPTLQDSSYVKIVWVLLQFHYEKKKCLSIKREFVCSQFI